MGWIHGSRMTQTYVHLSDREQDKTILKAYGIEVQDDTPIESDRPLNCPSCNEPNDWIARFCWKCGMILDKPLSDRKLQEETKVIGEHVRHIPGSGS